MPDKLERFTVHARRVLLLAQNAAELHHHSHVRADHLLLGMLREENGVAGRFLRGFGLHLAEVQAHVGQLPPPGGQTPSMKLELDGQVMTILSEAVRLARQSGSDYIETEHLLLALVQLPDGHAISILKGCGINLEAVKSEVVRIIQERSAPLNPDRLTPRAQRVINLAQGEAERLRHRTVGPEHLLLGLVHDEGSVAARVLDMLGASPQRVEDLVVQMSSAGELAPDARPELSVNAQKVLQIASEQAHRMGQSYIGTEHLLLGVVQEPVEITIDILKKLRIKPDAVVRQIDRVFEEKRSVQSAYENEKIDLSRFGPELERLHPATRHILILARDEAERLQHRILGTEHLLLVLSRQDGLPSRILNDFGLNPGRIEAVVMQRSQSERLDVKHPLHMHPDLIKTLTLAEEESVRFGNRIIGVAPEHFLLGLLRQKGGAAVETLKELGVNPARVYEQTCRILQEGRA